MIPDKKICPICELPYTSSSQLKNGEWAMHPLSTLLKGIQATDLNGYLCAKWGDYYLELYVHSKNDLRDNDPK